MAKLLKNKYGSPRISGEFLDCSMPVTFDQYSNCAFGCVYCFATFQRGIGGAKNEYWKKETIKSAPIERIKADMLEGKGKFGQFYKAKKVIQWGGMSDPMCPFEEEFGEGIEFMEFLKKHQYPYRISSKSDLPLRNPRYLEALTNPNLFYLASIITYDEKIAAKVEVGVPSPERRLKTLGALAKRGVYTALRLRPFIIGISDRNLEDLIRRASEEGVKAVSTEFFCLENRMNKTLKTRYELLSECCGFNIVNYYRRLSTGTGYLRLNRRIKEKYIAQIMGLCDKYGLAFSCSDAHHKERGCTGSCCGLPENHPTLGNWNKCQFTNALMIAKKAPDRCVRWKDVAKHDDFLKTLRYTDNLGLNTGSTKKRAQNRDFTLLEMMRNAWNTPNDAHSPYKYFGGMMKPLGVDENGDVIYKLIENGMPLCSHNCERCRN